VKQRINVLGIDFDNLTADEAFDKALELTRQGGYCVTPNPEIVWLARKDAQLSDIAANANLVIADGIGIIYAAKILGVPLKAKIPGIDLAERLMRHLTENTDNRGVFLFGAKPGIAEIAAANLIEKYPGLKIAGTQNGYDYDEKLLTERIATLNPALVFVCLGMKKQELYMARAYAELEAKKANCFMIGLGGALDVLSGTVERAPLKWRQLNLEWLYRLVKQPSRIKRMIKLPLFLISAVKERLFSRRAAVSRV
jgi:N-acetylglucosaminyldiphosphoundecaprenol N-acetyl-beta-D-mannosaminyltransferase